MSLTTTVLRRRTRDEYDDDWSNLHVARKRHMEDFTRDLCAEYGIPAAERQKLIEYSQARLLDNKFTHLQTDYLFIFDNSATHRKAFDGQHCQERSCNT
jgi:hypothetical protein